jgi:putative ABC transport system permease protein
VLEALIYGVKPTDVPTFVAVAGLLATVALVASFIPAYRATRVDPIRTLRDE